MYRLYDFLPSGNGYKVRQIEQKRKLGYKALNVMEQHLQNREFLVADKYTIADIGLYL